MPQILTQTLPESGVVKNFSFNQIQKEKYKILCASETSIPLFMQPWWLDVVCIKGTWDVCLSFDNAGEINGALVYYKVKLRGLIAAIVMPELTPYSGIWLKLSPLQKLKKHSHYTDTKKIVTSLVTQIPQVLLFHQKIHPQLTDWQPFFWAGYHGEIHYTYTLDLTDTEKIYAEMKGSVRTAIKKANTLVTIESSENANHFFALCKKSLEKQNAKQPFRLDTFVALDDVLKEKNCRKIFLAKDVQGNVHGGVYIVYDDSKKSAHYLIGGSDPVLRQSGAVMLLLWNAIVDAGNRGYTLFDFEGSMIPNVENAFRNFGATQVPFFRITKSQNKILDALTLFFPNYR